MGRPSPATQAKRNRERANKEKQEIKRMERAYRREHKKERPDGAEDPDLAGIRPGPQPLPQDY